MDGIGAVATDVRDSLMRVMGYGVGYVDSYMDRERIDRVVYCAVYFSELVGMVKSCMYRV